jgi:hypothetical protein
VVDDGREAHPIRAGHERDGDGHRAIPPAAEPADRQLERDGAFGVDRERLVEPGQGQQRRLGRCRQLPRRLPPGVPELDPRGTAGTVDAVDRQVDAVQVEGRVGGDQRGDDDAVTARRPGAVLRAKLDPRSLERFDDRIGGRARAGPDRDGQRGDGAQPAGRVQGANVSR